MHVEQRMRAALVSLCDAASLHPVRQARRLLAFAMHARKIGSHLMNLGFAANGSRDISRMKRFWAAAASFFTLADEARGLARKALGQERSRLGFAYAPCADAIPTWEKDRPKEVSI